MSNESRVRSHETRFRVRYAETDQMGVVYYANYLVWMEVGRAEYCRASGGRYRDMEVDDGILLAVVEAHCRYLRPARYDQEIAVKTWAIIYLPDSALYDRVNHGQSNQDFTAGNYPLRRSRELPRVHGEPALARW